MLRYGRIVAATALLAVMYTQARGEGRVLAPGEVSAQKLVTAYFAGTEALGHLHRLQDLAASLGLSSVDAALTKLVRDAEQGLGRFKEADATAFAASKVLSDAAIGRSALARALLALGGPLPSAEAQAEYDAVVAGLDAVGASK